MQLYLLLLLFANLLGNDLYNLAYLLGVRITNKVVKATIRAISVMTRVSKTQATAAQGAAAANPKDESLNAGIIVDNAAEDVTEEMDFGDFSWGAIMQDAKSGNNREDTIKSCLADKHFKLVRGLRVKNVKTFCQVGSNNRPYTRVTFVTKDKDFLPGIVIDNEHLDAFGSPTKHFGPSNNVFTSAIAVSGAMKETAKGAIFADQVADMTAVIIDPTRPVEIKGDSNIVNTLYAGGTIDVLCQYVPANTEYTNPFSTKAESEPRVFNEDRIMHHVISLTFGEVGEDYYRSRVLGGQH